MHSFASAIQFSARLVELSTAVDLENDRFHARNFRIERELAPTRIVSYLPRGDLDLGTGPPDEQHALWNGHHNGYLDDKVFAGWRGDDVDVDSPDTPETFRLRSSMDEYGHTGPELELVRVESLVMIARRLRVVRAEFADELRELAGEVAEERRSTGSPDSGRAMQLDALLREWQARDMDNRPIFAGFWHDASTLLTELRDGWANELRDRLGLVHLDPQDRLRPRGLDIVVFRYPVELVHRPERDGPRLLARPTVLDGRLSRGFCTFPAGSGRGCALDIEAHLGAPWQEVVHPALTFEARHIWAVGTVTKPVTRNLAAARWAHYQEVRNVADDEFAALVDDIEGDLS